MIVIVIAISIKKSLNNRNAASYLSASWHSRERQGHYVWSLATQLEVDTEVEGVDHDD